MKTSCAPDWPPSLPCPVCGSVAELSVELYDWPPSKKWKCPAGHFGSVFGNLDGTFEFYIHSAETTAAPAPSAASQLSPESGAQGDS
jgi:hypothetical protein